MAAVACMLQPGWECPGRSRQVTPPLNRVLLQLLLLVQGVHWRSLARAAGHAAQQAAQQLRGGGRRLRRACAAPGIGRPAAGIGLLLLVVVRLLRWLVVVLLLRRGIIAWALQELPQQLLQLRCGLRVAFRRRRRRRRGLAGCLRGQALAQQPGQLRLHTAGPDQGGLLGVGGGALGRLYGLRG